MSTTHPDTLVTECPTCERQMDAAEHLYRTHICPDHGPWYHDPSLGWLPIGTAGL